MVQGRNALFVDFPSGWGPVQGWTIKDPRRGKRVRWATRSGWFEAVLLGLQAVESKPVIQHAQHAAAQMLILIESGEL
jgi:hypothetical protein